MTARRSLPFVAVSLLLGCFMVPASAATPPEPAPAAVVDNSAGISRAQGEAILLELRRIRALLEKQQAPSQPAKRRPVQARVEFEGAEMLGRPDAPVTLLEFTDYQCPYCKRFVDQTLPELTRKYIDTGKLRFVSLDMPLSFHPQAMQAARAARCAGESDRFWDMRALLFANSKSLDRDDLVRYAAQLGLPAPAFAECLDSNRHDAAIDRAQQAARTAGFSGTPSFVLGRTADGFVDGTAVIGAKPLAEFERIIQQLLSGSDAEG